MSKKHRHRWRFTGFKVWHSLGNKPGGIAYEYFQCLDCGWTEERAYPAPTERILRLYAAGACEGKVSH